MGVCLHRAQLGNLEWAYLIRTLRYGLKGLWKWSVSLSLSLSLSLSGSSVNGTWREGYLAGDHGGYVENSLETGISFHMGLIGESGEGLIYWRH